MVLLGGSQSKPYKPSVRVFTRAGSEIPPPNEADIPYPPQTEDLIRIRAQELKGNRAGTEIRSVSGYFYNCVGMIFAARRCWIEVDHLYRILTDDGYRKIRQNEVMIGDIVVYKVENIQVPTHVALVIAADLWSNTMNIKVLSKWGLDAEFIHFADAVPERFGKPVEYWTERKA